MREHIHLQWFADAADGADAGSAPAADAPGPAEGPETEADPETDAKPERSPGPGGEAEGSAGAPQAPAAPDGEEARAQTASAAAAQLPTQALLLRLTQQQRAVRAQKILADWNADAAEIRKTYPDFDLERAFAEDGAFAAMVRAGLPLKKAYEAAHLDEILAAAMRYAVRRGGQMTADALRDGAARPQENSVLDRASSLKTTDVNSLTQKDILRIIGEAGRGAKITFR